MKTCRNLAFRSPQVVLLQLVLGLVVLASSACSRHEAAEFDIEGLQKAEVLKKLGRPSRETRRFGRQLKQSMLQPQLAATLGDEESVELWHYRVTNSREADVFFDGSGRVAEVMIYRTDVMY